MLLNKIKKYFFLFPAVVLGIFVGISAFSYDAPTYEVKEPEKIDFTKAVASKNELPTLVSLPQRTSTSVARVSEEVVLDESALYKDGVYEGSATGFGGTITVSVTIQSGSISSIEVISASGETPSYFEKAKAVLSNIISTNSTNVDTVSGATYSSKGLINATRDALSKAAYTPIPESESTSTADDSTQDASSQDSSNSSDSDASSDSTDSESYTYEDGTYEGEAQGFGGLIKVSIKIKNHKLTTVTILDASYETPSFFTKAKAIVSTIIEKQSTDVDAITGATYSSNGIKNAVFDALSKARKETSGTASDMSQATSDNTTDTASDTSQTTATSGTNTSDTSSANSSQSSTQPAPSPATESSGTISYASGTYTVSANVICLEDDLGYYDFNDYVLTMDINIANNLITSVGNFTTSDNDSTNMDYINIAAFGPGQSASGVVNRILSVSNLDSGISTANIDTVAGATRSSLAIIEAVNKALEEAKVSN